MRPVSYTHLDVYKRQAIYCTKTDIWKFLLNAKVYRLCSRMIGMCGEIKLDRFPLFTVFSHKNLLSMSEQYNNSNDN